MSRYFESIAVSRSEFEALKRFPEFMRSSAMARSCGWKARDSSRCFLPYPQECPEKSTTLPYYCDPKRSRYRLHSKSLFRR
jgi:hypothetical protein